MAGQLGIVVDQIIIFSILMAIGFIAARAGAINRDVLNALAKLIIKLILPALVLSVIADSGVTAKDFLISGRFALSVVLCFLILLSTGIAVSKLCKLENKTAGVFVALSTFGNMGFIGIPLLRAIFHEPVTQVCISVYTLFDILLLWTLGVFLCSRHQEESSIAGSLGKMINPTTVALFIGFIIVFLNIPIPRLVMETISGIGATSKYLTLLYLGGAMAFVPLSNLFRKKSILVLSAVKMLILPVCIYLLLGFFLPQIPRMILTIIVGLPSMSSVAMIAAEYQSDNEYATEAIFLTTLAGLFTIPMVSFITSKII